ncbi:Nrap protein, partial [Myriangium duriaei CBS 260.36]
GDQKASMLQLQIEELLGQVRPKKGKTATAAEACLHELKSAIESLSSKPAVSLVNAERELIKKSRVATPFPDPRPSHDAQYKLEFQPPAGVNVVGSYAASTALRTDKVLTVDMMVQMPDGLFQDKDYLDYRYFYRRAYYLACLAAGIRSAVQGKYGLDFESQAGNPLCPILVVQSAEASSAPKWRVNILPSISRKVFTDDRLLPSKSLVRHGAGNGEPTALYNSSIQAERQTVAYLKLIHSASTSCDDFKDASLLLRVWLQQRGFSGSLQSGGFGGFEATALMAALLLAGILSPRYNTYQLFKATLQYLVTKDCSKAPVTIGESESSAKVLVVADTPVLFDAARAHNLLFKMTVWSYKALRQQARITLNMLADTHFDTFEPAFIVREDSLHLKYDLCLALPSQLLSTKDEHDHLALSYRSKLYSVLTRGLGDRITQLDLRTDQSGHWNLGSARPSWRTKGEIVIALRLNPANASRTVDHGPSAEDKVAAAEFRKFWGDRAELRRFKDGSILESLVWSAKAGEQALIVDIVTSLVDKHFGSASATALRVLGGDVTRMITHAQGNSAFQPIMETFKTLETDIRSLDELPLTVRQVSAADPQACFASLQIPSISSPPVDVVVQFESSARWPDDLHAVQRTKAAFLLKISALLKESHPDLTSRVGLENTSIQALNQSFLDLAYPACTFRIRIHHERETALLQRLLKDKTTAPPDRDAAAAALAQYKRDFQASPAHTSAMAKLSTRFPALSATTRLLKKWFSSHHLLSHFPEPVVELLAARAFLHPAPYPVPGSPKTGLLRTLAWLGRWNWRTEPLIVLDPAAEKADNDALFTAARTRFEAWRRLDPALNRVVMFAASATDPDGTAWTDMTAAGPSRVVVGRMTQLAAAASELIRGHDWDLDTEALFGSSLDDYDFVLRMSSEVVQTKKKASGGFKNLVLAAEAQSGGGFDPVGMFLEELRAVYGSAVVFFYGGRENDVIAGLWNPVTAKRAWKVGLDYSSVPVIGEDEVEAVINKDGILAEIARLGGDMIARVE